MASYLKTLGNRLLKRLQPDRRPAPAHSASPVLKKVLTDRPPVRKSDGSGPPETSISALPPGSRILSNGNGKNVFSGELRPTDGEDMLAILDNPSLALEDENAAFDPYNKASFDRSNSWDKARHER